jgi:general secretion pathway protein L
LLTEGHLSFVRPIGLGDWKKELAATISALEFSDRGLPEQLIVLGTDSSELSALEGLPIRVSRLEEPAELSQHFSGSGSFDQLAGLYAVARACQGNALPDFRRGELAWTAGDAKLRRKMLLTLILAAVAIVLLFGFKLLQYRQASTDLASLNNSIQNIYREIFPGRTKAVDELAEVKGEIRKLGGADSSSGIIDILKKVADVKGSTINGLYEMELEGRSLTIKGDARSAQSVNEFKTALTPLMSAIELGEVKSRPDGSVTFSLTATIREANK